MNAGPRPWELLQPPLARRIGLVSGSGFFPALFLRQAAAAGVQVFVGAHRGETRAEDLREATEVLWVRAGQLGRLMKFFRSVDVRDIAFLGGIAKAQLFRSLRPDLLGMRFLCSLATTNDNALLSSLAKFFEGRGFRVFDPTVFLGDCFAPLGCFSRRQPTTQEIKDGELGWHTAGLLGQADVGQAVVVGSGSVVAVEAIEGTDALLRRAGALLGKHSGVLVKRVKPQQDRRIDLPTIGPRTVEIAAEAGVRCIFVEANATLMADPIALIRTADELGVCLIGKHAEMVMC